MSKLDKIIFSVSLFLTISFYGFVNLSFYIQVPSSYISGGLRLIVFTLSGYLFLKDIIRGQLDLRKFPVIAYIALLICSSLVFSLDKWEIYEVDQNMVSGKIYGAYNCFLAGLSILFTFYCGRDRLLYLANNPMLMFVPALFTVAIVIFIHRGSISDMSMAFNAYNISRSQTKETAINMFTIGLYLLLFGKTFWQRFVFGAAGVAAAFLNVILNESRSILVTIAVVGAAYIMLSFNRIKTFLSALLFSVVFVMFVVPVLIHTKGFERTLELLYYREDYLAGATSLSRIDLISDSFNAFLNSTVVFGAGQFMSGSHLIFTEILISTGLVGMALFLMFFLPSVRASARVVMLGFRNQEYSGMLLLAGFALADFVQCMFHGYTYDLYGSYFIPILLSFYNFDRGMNYARQGF